MSAFRTALLAAVVAAAGLPGLRAADPAPSGPNFVANPTLEAAAGERPDGWFPEAWGKDMKLTWAAEGRNGGKCVKIQSADTPRASQWMQNVRTLKPFSRYRFTGWVKTDKIESKNGGAGFMLHGVRTVDAPKPLTGTHDWTRIEMTFDTGTNDGVRVAGFFGLNGDATGTAWFDDFSVEFISSETLTPKLTVDAGKTAAPISPYIYGQFIEHLGRCVNGQGIWAEMIDDRKFFLPIGEEKFEKDAKGKPFKARTPWQVVGSPKNVKMVTENPYVGQFTPEVTVPADAPAGLRQERLGLVADKEYSGRIVLAGDAAPVTVAFIWGDAPADRATITVDKITGDFAKYPLRFKAGKTTENAKIEITSAKPGKFRIGAVSLMPADNVRGMRADTLAILKQLDSPVYRWPGGCFVGSYDWRDGLGTDRDKRPTRANTHWSGIEPNDFGLDEFLDFCKELKTEPYICVDTGPATPEFSAQEVQYVNGSPDTPMGKLRAANGHPEPYKCKFWAVGNEMFGNWQIGYMPLEQYVKKHNAVAQAMWKEDPSITLVGVGEVGNWSETMLKECAANMNHMSEHFYKQDWHPGGLMTHVRQIPEEIKRRVDAHRAYREKIPGLKEKNLQIVMDEWNYWYGGHVFGELGTRYFLKDGLGVAAGLHEYYRNSDMVFMANYAQTVNVIGAIKTTKNTAWMESTGLALQLYRKHYGVLPVTVSGDLRPLDVVAAFTADRKTLTLGVVNPTVTPVTLPVSFNGFAASPGAKATYTWFSGPDPEAYNDATAQDRIRIQSREFNWDNGTVTIPAMSAGVIAIPAP